jgi:hypothetical protein
MATAGAPPARRGTSPFVWILLIILGLFALGIVGMIGTGVYLARRGPAGIARIIQMANPNAEVVSTDDGAGRVTIRDRRTGKTVTMSFDDARHGRFRLEAEGDNGKHAAVQFGGSVQAPSWVPAYPGSEPRNLVAAEGEGDEGGGEGGSFAFTTADPPSRVQAFYEDEGRRAGMEVSVSGRGRETVVELRGPGEERKMQAVLTPRGGMTTVTVAYGRKR